MRCQRDHVDGAQCIGREEFAGDGITEFINSANGHDSRAVNDAVDALPLRDFAKGRDKFVTFVDPRRSDGQVL